MTTNNPISPESVRVLVQSMAKSIDEWREDEPQEDWWTYQRDHAGAAALIEAQERAYLALSERVGEMDAAIGAAIMHLERMGAKDWQITKRLRTALTQPNKEPIK